MYMIVMHINGASFYVRSDENDSFPTIEAAEDAITAIRNQLADLEDVTFEVVS